MSYEYRRTSSSSESTQPPMLKGEPNTKIAWEGSVKSSEKCNLNDSNPSMRGLGESRRAAEMGGSSRNKLSPLTPLKKASVERKDSAQSQIPSMGFAYSLPNLKALYSSSDVEQACMMHDYLSSGMNIGNGNNYVDPLYRQLNPTMGSTKNKPVWSLNQPLPHVLDRGLAAKMIQKNMDAISRASSRRGSTDISRAGSTTSAKDWKRLLRGVVPTEKLGDIEAQTQRGKAVGTDAMPTKLEPENPQKPSNTHIEDVSRRKKRALQNVNFSLGDESHASSIADVESKRLRNTQTIDGSTPAYAKLHEEPIEEEKKSTSVLGGNEIVASEDEGADIMTFPNYWAKIRYHMREPFAEFLGTLVLVIFGVGGNLQATVTKGSGGSYESLSFAWGFGCMLGVYVAGGISGGHINPAVTISMAVFRKFPWKKVPVYIVAQIIGAFFGGAMAYGYFWSSITEFEGGPHIRTVATGACLFTDPKSYVTWRNAFFDEFIGASILVGCLMALLDDSNAPPGNGMTALIVGFLVAAIGMALGYQTSFTINPARDLGPRIFASMIGYGPHAFHLTHWWWTWGAWAGPIAGGIAGGLIYDIFIFTGCESPVNYPDNGYIENRVGKFLHAEFHKHDGAASLSVGSDDNNNSNSGSKKSVPICP
ncbi:BBM_1a_G0016450.mRNA.1.CDS.1 [Saccharomyces cerevisiae]|nr:BBM_1a_G0016450.mRNA.1.CDS.1 [Saccharomyces cerevisiae]CAI7106474.1 BBM_1a_G0016450.mRNA.1.CDS.1 [Saccharomyces cerevisiae]